MKRKRKTRIKSKGKPKCITINTDASYEYKSKAGGYAFYIVCDLFRIKKWGMFKNPPGSPEEAEIMCIGNALATLLAQKEFPECEVIIINSDCIWGMKKIVARSSELSIKVGKIYDQLCEKLKSRGIFRHVKAHSGVQDARSHVNRWCDREAKIYMRQALKIALWSK